MDKIQGVVQQEPLEPDEVIDLATLKAKHLQELEKRQAELLAEFQAERLQRQQEQELKLEKELEEMQQKQLDELERAKSRSHATPRCGPLHMRWHRGATTQLPLWPRRSQPLQIGTLPRTSWGLFLGSLSARALQRSELVQGGGASRQ